ncbi:hypothetical protein N1851_012364 [Merluccius polli]|uniref:Uncharacterized protein n=1 Tax=Merluccius polli TaxID=89951 RepID=A0AA47P522_MERPO|nr:hypothetical protein N1851_012364 [Merluccius polli]
MTVLDRPKNLDRPRKNLDRPKCASAHRMPDGQSTPGCRAGTKRRAKRRRHKPAVPANILGNVRSLGNKMDKLSALVKTQREYRECSIFCFSETWLHSHIPDSSVEVPSYSLIRGERDCSKSRKKKGGGLALCE